MADEDERRGAMVAMHGEELAGMDRLIELVGRMETIERRLNRSGLTERRRWGLARELKILKSKLNGQNGA